MFELSFKLIIANHNYVFNIFYNENNNIIWQIINNEC